MAKSVSRILTSACVALGILLASFAAVAESLRIARTAIPPSRGIPFTAVSQPGVGIWSLMYDALTRIQQDGSVAPELAVSWESVSPTRWIFRLRPDVTFQNGEPFDAEAVIASIEFLKTEDGSRFYTASEVQNIASVEAIDPLAVAIETTLPDPLLDRRANLLWIIPPAALRDKGIESFAQEPIGTGPFRLVEWGNTSGAETFAAFADSWRAPAEVKSLTIYLMQDLITRVQALRSGQVDVAEQLSVDDVELLPDEEFQIFQRVTPTVTGLAFRVIGNESSPVADQAVRQALNLAIDRDMIVDQLYRGSAVAAGQGAAYMVNGHNPDVKPWPYDPERARTLLEEAGFDFDRELKFHVSAVTGNVDLVYQVVAQNLQAIGVQVELRAIPYASWLTSFLTSDWGDVDAFSLGWDNSAYFDAIRAETYTGCYKAQPFFCAPETKPVFDAISVEMDPDVRREKLQSYMTVMHEIAPAMWLVTGSEYAAAATNLRGLELTPRGIPYDLIRFGNAR